MDEQQTPAVENMPQAQQSAQEKQQRIGICEMREAADLILSDQCIEIAKALTDPEKRGCVSGVKLLCDLAKEKEKRGEPVAAATKLRSLAEQWAAEPEWQPESSEPES